MVLNDIIEQAAGRQSRGSDIQGNFFPIVDTIFKKILVHNTNTYKFT